MINIIQKTDCCGCGACMQVCPKQCILMVEDIEGFLYPQLDYAQCIDCGVCNKVCPVLNPEKARIPMRIYAAKNRNEAVRMQSSSGGIFTILAERVINKGGVVFGAKFNEQWEVVHAYTETFEGLSCFRGSKYVQSNIGNSYCDVQHFLKQGREVLFSGTPCQIAGLRRYLRCDYDNLLTIDVVCHGVPSPKVWRTYLKEVLYSKKGIEKNANPSSLVIKEISFRNKFKGWKDYSFIIRVAPRLEMGKTFTLLQETLNSNLFMRGFLSNLYLRPSCHACPTRHLKSGSDITIADYWGVASILPSFDDDKGVGLVLVNTVKGDQAYDLQKTISIETTYQQAFMSNPCLERSVLVPNKRKEFFDAGYANLQDLILRLTRYTYTQRIKTIAIACLPRILKKNKLLLLIKKVGR